MPRGVQRRWTSGERARHSIQIGLTIYFVSNAPSCRCCSSFGGPVSCVLLVLFVVVTYITKYTGPCPSVGRPPVGGCMWPSGHNNYRQRWGWNVGYSAGRAWTILMAAAVQERTFCSLPPLPAGYPSIGLLLSNIARCCCILQSQSPSSDSSLDTEILTELNEGPFPSLPYKGELSIIMYLRRERRRRWALALMRLLLVAGLNSVKPGQRRIEGMFFGNKQINWNLSNSKGITQNNPLWLTPSFVCFEAPGQQQR